jgi:hypothetical protein
MGKGAAMNWTAAAATAGLLALVGCGSDIDATADSRIVRDYLSKVMQSRSNSVPQITRARLEADALPRIKVAIDSRKMTAILGKLAVNGPVVTWVAADGATIALRDGVAIATRGLGDDLMSSYAPTANVLAQAAGTLTRSHYYIDGRDKGLALTLRCEVRAMGDETIEIVERSYRTRHISESCTGTDVAFENHYWFEKGGSIRRSTQWISPEIKSVQIDVLYP